MKMTILIFCVVFVFSGTLPARANIYQIPLEVSVPVEDTAGTGITKAYNRLVLGVDPGATEDYDPQWDTPALFRTPDPENPPLLMAYIDHPEYGPDRRQLWRDIRSNTGGPDGGKKRWDVTVALSLSEIGKTVTLAWALPPSLSASREAVTLSDSDAESPISIDMRSQSSYRFVNSSASSPRTFTVSITSPGGSSDKGSSGFFGCGVIREMNGDPPDTGSSIAILLNFLLLLSPIILRFRRFRWSD